MNQTAKIELAYATVRVKKTKRPNAKCITCGKRIYSFEASLGFQGVRCNECKNEVEDE